MKYHIALYCLLFLFLATVCAADTTTPAPATTAQHSTVTQPPDASFDVKYANGTVCLKAILGIEFNLPYKKKDSTTGMAKFDLPIDAIVDEDKSKCGSTVSRLVLNFPDTDYNITFDFVKDGDVFYANMTTFDYIQDDVHFVNASTEGSMKAQTTEQLFKAAVNKSYECQADQTYNFTSGGTLMTSGVRLQPFDIMNNNFSTAAVCAADMTTPAPATTAQHSTVTQPPDVSFDVKYANGTVCLKAILGIEFNLPYNKTDNTTGMAKFDLPLGTTVDEDKSECGSTVSRLVLNFPETDYNITFDFVKDGDVFYANMTSFDYIHSESDFPNATTTGSMKAQTTEQLFKAAVNKSYECQANQTYNFTSGGTLMTSGVRLQPFDIKNNNFSAADVCYADNPTPPPTTQVTTVAPPTSPPQPKAGSWNITSGNKTCMLMKMAISFNFTYENDKNKTVTVAMDVDPDKTNSSESSCGNTTSSFVLLFTGYENWMMNMTFTTSSSSEDALSASGSGTYSLDSFTLNYVYTDDVFPGVKDEGKQMTSHSNETEFKVDLGNSYKCDKAQTYKLDNFTKVTLSDVKIQPFAGKSEGGYGTEEDCEADQSTSNIVPIAVGCALAGLVIIVLIAYLIGRRRSHAKGYQSV